MSGVCSLFHGCPRRKQQIPPLRLPFGFAQGPAPVGMTSGCVFRERSAYFCATNSLARLSSGLVEFDPSQTFNSSE